MLKQSTLLAIIITVYVILGALYAWQTPRWQAPDEPAHYNFIRYLVEQKSLPELTVECYNQDYLNQLRNEKFPPGLPIDSVCYEHYQPPLYYFASAPIFALSGGNLFVVRLFGVVLGAVSLFFIHQSIALFLPQTIFPLATTAFAAFVPMHLTMLASVNNDSLAELLYILLIYLLLRWLFQKPTASVPLSAGIVLGLILLTKVTVYPAVIMAAFIIFLANSRLNVFTGNALRVYLPALLMGLLMYIRNALVYGGFDILGLARHDAVVVGQPRTVDLLAGIGWPVYLNNLARTTFHSFWGQFGWMAVPMDGRVYLVLFMATVTALFGLVLWALRHFPKEKEPRQGLAVMALGLLLTLGIFIGLNLSFVQFQGRYFFSALMPLGLFFSLGLFEACRKKNAFWLSALMAIIMLGVAVSSLQNDGLDKWGVLISGSAMALFFVRRWLPERAANWFVTGFYMGLATLAGLSVWWFIVPNL